MLEALISDFDGVLFDSESLHLEAGRRVLSELGLTLPYSLYQTKYIGMTDFAILQDFLSLNGYEASPDAIRKLIYKKMHYFKQMLQDYESLEPVKGASQFLVDAQNYIRKFAICTNANRPDIELVLNKLDGGALQRHFQFVITSDDVAQGKPEPEGYLKAAECLEVLPHHCFVIEDSKGGIRAGKRAGMTVVGLTTSHAEEVLQEADYIAQSYEDIGFWLKQ